MIDGNILTLTPELNNPEIFKISLSSNSLILYDQQGKLFRELHKLK